MKRLLAGVLAAVLSLVPTGSTWSEYREASDNAGLAALARTHNELRSEAPEDDSWLSAAQARLGALFDGSEEAGYAGPVLAGPLAVDPASGPGSLPEPGEATPVFVAEPPAARTGRGTLVLIHVDGLAYRWLVEAMRRGLVPNLTALVAAGGHRAAPYLCGVPTVTMAVQSAILYDRLLPGNEWYSKSRKAESIANIRETELPEETGLLHGGRVYLSEISGGAAEGAHVGRFHQENVAKVGAFRAALRELGSGLPLFARFLFSRNPLTAFPATFWRLFRDAFRMKADFAERGFDTPLDRKAPWFLSIIKHLFSSVALEGVKKAIRDGVPVVYADFPSYDEEAHYYGPDSAEAFEALAGIDERLGEVIAVARQHGAVMAVFSDHGQTPAVNFIRTFGMTAQAMVDRLARESRPDAKDGDLVFWHVYSMGNVYVADTPGHVDASAVEGRYPGFIRRLAGHPGVGLVASRENGRIVLHGKGGWAPLDAALSDAASGQASLLAPYADELASAEVLARQIRNYMELEESGDLVVFAPYENGAAVDYNVKYTIVAQHGGIGGDQMHPFILYDPGSLSLDPAAMLDARGLHAAFASYLGR